MTPSQENKALAFLFALFYKQEMFHGTYIAEKVEMAVRHPDGLRTLLDSGNQARYDEYMAQLGIERYP